MKPVEIYTHFVEIRGDESTKCDFKQSGNYGRICKQNCQLLDGATSRKLTILKREYSNIYYIIIYKFLIHKVLTKTFNQKYHSQFQCFLTIIPSYQLKN